MKLNLIGNAIYGDALKLKSMEIFEELILMLEK